MGMIGNSLAQGLISGANIQDGTVDTVDIKDLAVTPSKLSTGSPFWDSLGNFGLGTSSPEQRLHVANGSAGFAAIKFTNSAASAGIISYSGDNFLFYTANTERVRIDSSGNLGLGVTPSAWWGSSRALEIGGSATGYIAFNAPTSNSGGYIYANAHFNGTSNLYKNNGYAANYAINPGDGSHRWYTAPSGTAGNAISFTQAMTLDASGRLIIGNSSGSSPLHVYGNSSISTSDWYGSSFTQRIQALGGNNQQAALQLIARGPDGAPCGVSIHAIPGSGTDSYRGSMISTITGDSTGPSYWAIRNFNPSAANTADIARFTYDGNFLLGATSNSGYASSRLVVIKSSTGNERCAHIESSSLYEVLRVRASNSTYQDVMLRLDINKAPATDFYFISADTTSGARFLVRGDGNVSNTNNSFGAISDVKLKENVVDATPKLDAMMQVRVVNYNLIGDAQKQIGVIAQELEQIFPGMIDETPDRDSEGNDLGTTTKSVKYSVFVPMLIKAIQEQQAIIEQLKADVAALKGAA